MTVPTLRNTLPVLGAILTFPSILSTTPWWIWTQDSSQNDHQVAVSNKLLPGAALKPWPDALGVAYLGFREPPADDQGLMV